MIQLLKHEKKPVAQEIYQIFQAAYQVEADLIGVEVFPPLQRSALDIQGSITQFYGYWENEKLAAVIEISFASSVLDIASLVVEPQFFRRGLASQLLHFILEAFAWETAEVETAAVNEPAITLYQKFGFVEKKRWVPGHGIPKVMLRHDLNCALD